MHSTVLIGEGNFNSHAHVERDASGFLQIAFAALFQLTRSRGAWLCVEFCDRSLIDFNSHAHVERDAKILL